MFFNLRKKNHLVRKLEMYVLEQSPSSVHKTTAAYIKLSFFWKQFIQNEDPLAIYRTLKKSKIGITSASHNLVEQIIVIKFAKYSEGYRSEKEHKIFLDAINFN